MQNAMAKPSSTGKGDATTTTISTTTSTSSTPVESSSSLLQVQASASNDQSNVLSHLQTSFMTDNSDSDDDDVSEIKSFLVEQAEYDDANMLDSKFHYEEESMLDSKFQLLSESPNSVNDCSPCTDLRNVDPVTQAKLAALLEAAGLGKLSAAVDGKQYTDPEVLRKLTSSVSCALDEAAAALNRMRAENSGQMAHSSEGRSLAEACSDGDVKAVRMLLDEGHSSVHETTEEGESLLSFACSSGYFELAHILLSKKANVDDRGIKGDCTPLMGAASGGHVDIVKLLIAHGADVNAQSQSGNTPLMCACAGGHEEVVSVLLQSGANVEDHNENGHTPLMEAASAGHVPVAKILLEHGAGINTHSNEFKESALTLACYKGHLEMVRFLLEAGADQEHKTDEMHTALMEASMDGHVEVARLLLNSGAQVNMPADSFESPLTLAACGGHVDLAMLLLERGANIEEVNDEGYTPLMEASREGHEEMVALLLSQGADINAQTEETQETALTLACCGGFLEVADFLIKAGANIELGASSPLMEAAQEGHLELVRYLLDAGSNVNAPTATGDTALTYACENGHTDVADLLLQAGAYLEHESEGGRTPLMKSARSGHLCTVQFLISRGADINRRTSNNDHTPLSLACAGGHLAVVELLLAHGSDPTHKLKDNSTMLIEAAKGGHTNVVQLLLDYPNSMVASPPPPPPPTSAEALSAISSTTLDQNAEPPRVPPHGLQVVQSDAPIMAVPQANAAGMAATSQSFLHNIQPGIVDPAQLQGTVQIPGLQAPNVRPNLPVQRSLLRNSNSNQLAKPAAVPATNNILKQDAALMTPQLVQLIKNCQQQAAMVNVASELSYDFEKSLVEGVSNAAAVAAAGMGLDLGMGGVDDKDLRPSERLEACINNMMKKAEMMHHNREEQILQKQQILEELQRVERELQEKAQAQILLNAQYSLDHIQQSLPPSSLTNTASSASTILDDHLKTLAASVPQSDVPLKGHLNLNLKSVPLSPDTRPALPPVTTISSKVCTKTTSSVPTGTNFDVPPVKFPRVPGAIEISFEASEDEHNKTFDVDSTDESKINEPVMSETSSKSDISSSAESLSICSAATQTTTTLAKNVKSSDAVTETVPSSNVVSSPAVSSSMNASKLKPKNKLQNKPQVDMMADARNLLPNIPIDPDTGAMFLGDSSFSGLMPRLEQDLAAALLGHTTPIPTLTSLLSALNLGGAPSLMMAALESNDVTLAASGLMVASPARNLHDADDSASVLSNQIAKINQYGSLVFAGQEPSSAQVQTAMALAAQSYMPQTSSSCNVATQCMVDPCLMGQSNATVAHTQLPDTPSIPLPFLPSSNQSPSSPQTSPTLYPPIDIGKFDIDSQTDSNHDTALTLACAGGHEELVTLLLHRGANIEHRDKKGFTPLILAGTAGHAGVVEILLNNVAEIEAQSERTKDTPLSLACSGGRYEVVEILLARGANKEHRNVSDYTPLSLAASGGYVNIIKLLLNHGAEINSRTGSKLGISPLMLAAMNGHTAAVKLLLDMGSDINAQIETNRNTALTLACFQGRHEVVSLLVDRKANIEHRAKTGLTPLMEAASGGYTEVGCVLLDKGADVNAPPVPSSRDTALTIAADKGHYRFVGLLLSRGAAVDVKNKKGNSPLWLACNGGHLDVVQLLVSVEADIDSQDNRKVSCLMAAFRKGHIKVVKWMVKHVSQFPSDQECTRYIATISDKDLLKKCHQCMEIIRTAKDRQEAEANKNASILLEELDMEKSREENKKAAAARRRERKRLKRKEKQAGKDQNPKEESENLKNETKNWVTEECKRNDTIVEKIKTPLLPPGVTLTPIKVGECLPPKREEKNTVSIMKIETTSSSSEPMVTNMGTVIVVETKSSNVPHVDQNRSSSKSQSMITISRINSNTVTVSSSHPDSKNLVSITASSSSSTKQISKTKNVKPAEPSSVVCSIKVPPEKSKGKEASKKHDKPLKEKQSNKENKPTKEKLTTKSQIIVAVSCSATTSTTATLTAASPRTSNVVAKTTLTNSNKNSKKKDDKAMSRKKDQTTNEVSPEKVGDEAAIAKDLVIEPLSTTGIGDLDDFGSLPDNHNKNSRNGKNKSSNAAITTLNTFSDLPLDVHEWESITEKSPSLRSPNSLVVNSMRSGVSHSPNSSSSPKKSQKKEDGWKEVVRRSKKVSVPSNAISRVIGRGGCNINAIREVSGAHIEVEKQRGAGDRTIIIRGSAEATRQAHQLITALIKDPDRELLELLPKSAAAAISSRTESRNSSSVSGSSVSKSGKSASMPTPGLSIYSTPPFPATSAPKQATRPGIPTTSLSNVGAAFPANQASSSWPPFSSPMMLVTNSPVRKVEPKSPAVRQLFPESNGKSTLNQSVASVSKSVVSYTTAVMAPGKNTKTVTTVSTSMSVQDYKANHPPRMMNQQANAFENMGQFKPVMSQNGPLRAAGVQQNNSNSSSGSSGSPIAQDYSPFNSIFSKVAQQSVWGKGMNFASVAASGVVSLAPTNPTIGPLHQSTISSPSPNSGHELQSEPVDISKAPGYRGNGSHMSPGSNSTGSGHYSAPNTPPIAPIGAPSHNAGSQASPAAPSPPVRPSSLPEQSLNTDKSQSGSMASPVPGMSVNNLSVRVSALQVSSSEKHLATNAPSSYMANGTNVGGGILSVASLAPGGPVVMNSIGNQPRLPVHQQGMPPIPGQHVYPSRFMPPPGSLQNVVFAQNAVNVSMASSNNIIQSNLNPNAPDFSSRSNGIGGSIMHPNVQPRLQPPPNYMEANLNHQSAFRPPPIMQNHSYMQQQNSNPPAGYPAPQGSSRMPQFLPHAGIPLDFITSLTPEAATAALQALNINRHQNMNSENNFSQMSNIAAQESNMDNDQQRQSNSNSGSDQSSNSSNSAVGQPINPALGEDRKSFPRPIGTERAHRKTPVFGGVSDVKGIWSFNNSDPSGANWMTNMPSSQPMMSMNNDNSKMPPAPHMLPNGNVLQDFHSSVMASAANRMNAGDGLQVPIESTSHPVDPLYQGGNSSNQGSISNHFNSMPGVGPSSYLKNMPPNIMAAMVNQHHYNNASNGPTAGDFWVPTKLQTSGAGASSINHHSSSTVSQSDQKPMWNNSEWNPQPKV